MAAHEFTEGVLIVIGKNSRNEVRIRKLHSRNITFPVAAEECPFCFPTSIQTTNPTQNETHPAPPRAPSPVFTRRKPNHQPEAHHGPNNPAAHVRASAHGSHLRCKQFSGNRLTFLHHHADRPLPHPASYKRG